MRGQTGWRMLCFSDARLAMMPDLTRADSGACTSSGVSVPATSGAWD
jgi:hypothetical protein